MSRMLHTVAYVQSLEALLAERGVPASELMALAGEALRRCLRANWPEARHILIVAGPGNNGGDGYVLARLLHGYARMRVRVLALAPPAAVEARAAADAWRAVGGSCEPWHTADALPDADLIVDALFGIGLSRPLVGPAGHLVEAINSHPAPVLAVDVPSGLDADTGACGSIAVRAARTLCLLADKRGLHTGRAVDLVGDLAFDDLGLSGNPVLQESAADEACDEAGAPPGCRLLDRADLRRWLPPRRRGAHKGDHGHALVVGGDVGMAGAVAIAGHAALRAGAGWTSIATRDAHAALVAPMHPELMRHGVEDAGALAPLLKRVDAVAIGPGLGTGRWGRLLLDGVLDEQIPSVLDADALNLLGARPRRLGPVTVITPHPGEAARLLGRSTGDVECDRFAAARELAIRFDCIAVLKGAGTIVDDGNGCVVCPHGNPGMASGGTGDALTGVIVAFLAQGLSPWQAAAAGVLAHALAGDAAAHNGERGLLASDLIAELRAVVNP